MKCPKIFTYGYSALCEIPGSFCTQMFTDITQLHLHRVISVQFASSHLKLMLYYPILKMNWALNRICSGYV